MEEVQKKPMEADQILQDIFGIARKLDEIKVFHNILPFNNTELQFMKVIVLADEAGKRVISSDIARSLGITRSAVSQMVKKLEDEKIHGLTFIELTACSGGCVGGTLTVENA